MNTLITRNAWLLLAAINALLFALSAQAASFDCAKARTKVEHIICDTPEISKLDEELAITYKAAVKDKTRVSAIKHAQKRWMMERNGCADAECVKGAYEKRLSLLQPAIPAPLALSANTGQSRDGTAAAPHAACANEDQRDGSNIRVQDIEGLYRQSVEGLPAIIGRPEEKLSGYNYLAITPLAGNKIRVRLSTKEINGHDCGIDGEALLCGRTIRLIPNGEEKSALDINKQPVPRLRVTENNIGFIPDSNKNFVSGNPYCGAMGYLRQSFVRGTRKLKIDDSVFNQ